MLRIIEHYVKLSTNLGGNKTAESTANDGTGKSYGKGTKLSPALGSQVTAILS